MLLRYLSGQFSHTHSLPYTHFISQSSPQPIVITSTDYGYPISFMLSQQVNNSTLLQPSRLSNIISIINSNRVWQSYNHCSECSVFSENGLTIYPCTISVEGDKSIVLQCAQLLSGNVSLLRPRPPSYGGEEVVVSVTTYWASYGRKTIVLTTY
jgi:hypothetical protein